MNDVIFIGTEFQENDIDIALKKAQEQRCSNKNNHYFFISPGKPSKKLNKRIEENSNVYHIQWTAKEFLDETVAVVKVLETARKKAGIEF